MIGRARKIANNNDADETELFKVWKEYEGIAMHFNELIIQLRTRSLAGVAAILALYGFVTKGDTPEEFRWGVLAAVFFLLSVVWIAIWILDHCYYTRLLLGAVRAILEIEDKSAAKPPPAGAIALNLSHRIEETVWGNFGGLTQTRAPRGIVWFYRLVLFTLFLGFAGSLFQYFWNKQISVPAAAQLIPADGRLFFKPDPTVTDPRNAS